MKNALVVENNPIMLAALVGMLKSQSGLLNVFSAKSGKEALDLVAVQDIHIVVTGLYLPEIEAVEMAAFLAEKYPGTPVIVMTNSSSPMLRTRIKQIPTAVHFDRALDIHMLTKRIFTELGINYGGQVRGVALTSFLQMVELEGQNCVLQIAAKGGTGKLWINRGEIVDAATGDLRGEAAALAVLCWEDVVIDINYTVEERPVAITMPLMGLMMESNRRNDEKQSRQSNQRKHDRYSLLVAVDYHVRDITYQCFLRDISKGGAYIETDQGIQVGQRIHLTLSTPDLHRPVFIDCQVVRCDDRGIGVRFGDLSLQQKKVIEMLEKKSPKAADDAETIIIGPM